MEVVAGVGCMRGKPSKTAQWEARSCGALWAMIRTWPLTVNGMECHGRVLSRSDVVLVQFKCINLAIMFRIEYRRIKVEAWW